MGMYQHLLTRRVRVSTTAASEKGSPYRGEYGEITGWRADHESLELTSLDVRLDSGVTIEEITPDEVEGLDY